ncbi:Altered inheritance of mitochondria protein 24 [Raphanus sativus]|nr:Altered inheritance of mitochondria protein 24 [Raphanus sativus]
MEPLRGDCCSSKPMKLFHVITSTSYSVNFSKFSGGVEPPQSLCFTTRWPHRFSQLHSSPISTRFNKIESHLFRFLGGETQVGQVKQTSFFIFSFFSRLKMLYPPSFLTLLIRCWQIMLKSEERVISNPGSMCYMSGSGEMENTYPEQEVRVLQWIFRKEYCNQPTSSEYWAKRWICGCCCTLFRSLPIDLAMFGGEILCQMDSFYRQ